MMKLFCWHKWILNSKTRGLKGGGMRYNGKIVIETTTAFNCSKCGKLKIVKSEE